MKHSHIPTSQNEPLMKFLVEIIDVFRDFSQGLHGNRIPLNNEKVLKYAKFLNNLARLQGKDDIFDVTAFEAGGAQPQVDAVFRGKNPFEVVRQVREVFEGIIRPLERGTNVFMLSERPKDEIRHVLKEYARSVAGLELPNEMSKELLRFKIFDSQAVFSRVTPVLDVMKELRDEGYPVGIEIAIPYTNNEHLGDKNAYTDEFYLHKINEAVKLRKEYGFPEDAFRVSLKDMVGQMNGKSSYRLISAIAQDLKKQNENIRIGLHLHETGLALDAYCEAIRAVEEENWTIAVDTTNSKKSMDVYHSNPAEMYRVTGFVPTLALHEELITRGIRENGLGFSKEQIAIMEEMGEISDDVAADYALTRAAGGMKGSDVNRYGIAGGAYASFRTAITTAGYAKTLGISDDDAAHLLGHALIVVKEKLGTQASPVTPGYQETQIGACNIVNNMIKKGMLEAGMSIDKMKEVVLTVFDKAPNETDEDVKKRMKELFVTGLPDTSIRFWSGEMPSECEIHTNNPNVRVHPALRELIPLKTQQKDIASNLPKITKDANRLHAEGYLKPTRTLAYSVLRALQKRGTVVSHHPQFFFSNKKEFVYEIVDKFEEKGVVYLEPNGKPDSEWRKKVAECVAECQKDGLILPDAPGHQGDVALYVTHLLSERTVSDAMAYGIILEASGKNLDQAYRQPWKHEPEANLYGKDKMEYERDKARAAAGLDISNEADIAQRIRKHHFNGNIDTKKAKELLNVLFKQEVNSIKLSAFKLVNGAIIHKAAKAAEEVLKDNGDGTIKDVIIKIAYDIYESQSKEIDEKHFHGQQFFFNKSMRLAIAFQCIAQEIAKERDYTSYDVKQIFKVVYQIFKETKQNIEKQYNKSPIAGEVFAVNEDIKKGTKVKKGDYLYTLYASKAERKIYAEHDQVVDEVLIKKGQKLESGQAAIRMQVPEEQVKLEKRVKAYNEHNKNDGTVYSCSSVLRDLINTLQQRNEENKKEVDGIDAELNGLDSKNASKQERHHHNKRGYHSSVHNENGGKFDDSKDTIHIVLNRGGCQSKIGTTLEIYGHNVYYTYIPGDVSTPVIANADPKKLIQISDYSDLVSLERTFREFAKEHPGMTLVIHPGWGFVSENDKFVEMIERLAEEGIKIKFAGPASEPMRNAGHKRMFRDLMKAVEDKNTNAPKFNPPYFANHNVKAERIKEYIDALKEDRTHLLDAIYRKEFNAIKAMGGDVMIKAVYGGGGKGIKGFRYDKSKSDSENYLTYLTTLYENTAFAEKQFGDGECMVEKRIRGNAHHIEAQIAVTNGQAVVLGIRVCTPQSGGKNKGGQKYLEYNIIQGDYPPVFVKIINQVAQMAADQLAAINYKGVATIEFMGVIDKLMEVLETVKGKSEAEQIAAILNNLSDIFVGLEVNTRLQVEHVVTELVAHHITGKALPLPELIYHLAVNPENLGVYEVIAKVTGMNKEEIDSLKEPCKQRFLHSRVVSQRYNFQNGSIEASYVSDVMWPTQITTEIAKRHHIKFFIHGGLGRGDMDAQIGAIAGEKENVVAAMRDLVEFLQCSMIYERRYPLKEALEETGLEASLMLMDKVFHSENGGHINHGFATSTTDAALDRIENGESVIDEMIDIKLPWQQSVVVSQLYAMIDAVAHDNRKHVKIDFSVANDNGKPVVGGFTAMLANQQKQLVV